ncbi:hypothetical protein CYMTET_11259 [Cymbomonas tetramitiformis]|uniref:Uncharacterized protein n=1 Tax=Cymbomonas tetramitiformis TaxID=36881 RepID=A0AAE0GMT7_9CHLO|nr:hypothetical protein CYMTET_11259 [Cymbomonas tetramitiformis]|eukprot:gene30227-37757_t
MTALGNGASSPASINNSLFEDVSSSEERPEVVVPEVVVNDVQHSLDSCKGMSPDATGGSCLAGVSRCSVNFDTLRSAAEQLSGFICNGKDTLFDQRYFITAIWVWTLAVLAVFEWGYQIDLTDLALLAASFNGFLGFIIGLRINLCYGRWWEGRCLWGKQIFASIELMQQSASWIDDTKLYDTTRRYIVLFAFACKALLRDEPFCSTKKDQRLLLHGIVPLTTAEEVRNINDLAGWLPYFCLEVLRKTVTKAAQQSADLKSDNGLANFQFLQMNSLITDLATCIGGSIRVKNAPMPLNTTLILKFLIFVTLSMNPFLLYDLLGLAGTMGVNFGLTIVYNLLTGLANELEQPFGHDLGDLNLEAFCQAILSQVSAVHERRQYALVVSEDGAQQEIISPGWGILKEKFNFSSRDSVKK